MCYNTQTSLQFSPRVLLCITLSASSTRPYVLVFLLQLPIFLCCIVAIAFIAINLTPLTVAFRYCRQAAFEKIYLDVCTQMNETGLCFAVCSCLLLTFFYLITHQINRIPQNTQRCRNVCIFKESVKFMSIFWVLRMFRICLSLLVPTLIRF